MSFLRILSRNTPKPIKILTCSRILKYSTAKSDNQSETNKPIPYSKSPANQWQAKYSRVGTDSDRLWYEPHVVLFSVAVFMIYFCVLREEGEVDKEFDKTLYNRIKGFEEQQIKIALKYNQEHGLPTEELQYRLKELTELAK